MAYQVFSDAILRPKPNQRRVVMIVTDETEHDALVSITVNVMNSTEFRGYTTVFFYADQDAAIAHQWLVEISGQRGGALYVNTDNNADDRAVIADHFRL